MANLYELNHLIEEFELEIDEETGEVTNLDDLAELELERDEKIENIALWIKNLKADAAAYKAEKDAFADKERAAKKKIESLKAYLSDALHGEKFKTTRVQISYRTAKSVHVNDWTKLPPDLLRVSEPEPDKKTIGDLLRAGRFIEGAELVEKTSIQIK